MYVVDGTSHLWQFCLPSQPWHMYVTDRSSHLCIPFLTIINIDICMSRMGRSIPDWLECSIHNFENDNKNFQVTVGTSHPLHYRNDDKNVPSMVQLERPICNTTGMIIKNFYPSQTWDVLSMTLCVYHPNHDVCHELDVPSATSWDVPSVTVRTIVNSSMFVDICRCMVRMGHPICDWSGRPICDYGNDNKKCPPPSHGWDLLSMTLCVNHRNRDICMSWIQRPIHDWLGHPIREG